MLHAQAALKASQEEVVTVIAQACAAELQVTGARPAFAVPLSHRALHKHAHNMLTPLSPIYRHGTAVEGAGRPPQSTREGAYGYGQQGSTRPACASTQQP